jgi:peptidoglycan hydrolase CwlO-like protein
MDNKYTLGKYILITILVIVLLISLWLGVSKYFELVGGTPTQDIDYQPTWGRMETNYDEQIQRSNEQIEDLHTDLDTIDAEIDAIERALNNIEK